MKTQKLLTPLAMAMVALLSVGAHATGYPGSDGASATVVDIQENKNNTSFNKTVENTAEVEGSLGGASGNVGVNVAAGDNNQQANAAAIATADSAFVFGFGLLGGSAQASIDVYQNNQHNDLTNYGVPNDASLTDSAGGTSGNLGINIAAGNSNQQKNDMAVASSDTAYTAGANVLVHQNSSDNSVSNLDLGGSHGHWGYQPGVPVVNNAVMSGSLGGVSGNVGVNIAAGSGNQQSNSLAIAAGCNACPSPSL
ncbi:hypothetical protein [Halopseudomonas pelagia]|uniref:hypothetical protein n=1 Tax=Halopseudomonas pelagia TaxID=553151 RepID=UPI0003A61D89|nr:hypothetical protein [Halopseudomonas pelagia]|tara:strand:- start:1739 stop:2497 length:759 start_codon:yes stop_codon:yes gene_type:complete